MWHQTDCSLFEATKNGVICGSLSNIKALRVRQTDNVLPSRKMTLIHFANVIKDIAQEGSLKELTAASMQMSYTATMLDNFDKPVLRNAASPPESKMRFCNDVLKIIAEKYESEGRYDLLHNTASMILLGCELSLMCKEEG